MKDVSKSLSRRFSAHCSFVALIASGLLLGPYATVCSADSADVTEYLTPGMWACANQGLGVYADMDGDGVWETFVVFNTINGQADGENIGFGCGAINYFFTGDVNMCGGGTPATGRFSVWFVDALASGFVANNPATWTYKSVPGVSVWVGSDDCNLDSAPSPYRQVNAYTERGQGGTLVGSYSHILGDTATQYQTCQFSSSQGIKEIFARSDSCENELDCFIIKSGAYKVQPFQITSIVRSNANDLFITWNTVGKTNIVQVNPVILHWDGSLSTNILWVLTNIVVTTTTTNFLDVGALTKGRARYYRILSPQ